MPFIPDEEGNGPVIDVTPPSDAEKIAAEFGQSAIPATGAGVIGPWWVYLLLAFGLYLLWED